MFAHSHRWARFGAAALLAVGACGGDDDAGPGGSVPTESAAVAPASHGSQDAEQALYAAAEDEPALVWYTSRNETTALATLEAFQARYPGVDVSLVRLVGTDLINRVALQFDTGTTDGGVVVFGDRTPWSEGVAAGWFEPLTEDDFPWIEAYPEGMFADGLATIGIARSGLAYNTELVGEPLTSWADLLRPELKDQILISDPRTISTTLAILEVMRDDHGDDFIVRLREQNPVIVAGAAAAIDQVASGEYQVVLALNRENVAVAQERGAPVEFVAPPPGAGFPWHVAVMAGTPSPNAARLFYGYLLTEEGQTTFHGAGADWYPASGEPLENFVESPFAEAEADRALLLGELGLDD